MLNFQNIFLSHTFDLTTGLVSKHVWQDIDYTISIKVNVIHLR